MNDTKNETKEELDCHVTVNDGSYMTCDMIEEETTEEEDIQPDYDIQRIQPADIGRTDNGHV